ncbi:uncharacterized protein [Drosophila bipectinata]|uniref:uncharacterized protein isoform X3 n=1 Tax=Drosophila bipectinata TaxID=42026 RepID=UPI001C89797A|nr:uncharacterized protein LOC108120596 isoform X2 [Drosophila bipectinata]
MSDSSTTPSPPEDSDSNERNSTSSQGSVSKELAHKIWRVTPNDLAQNIPALANSAYPCIGGVEWGSGGASSKNSANDSANAFISEVERALYGNSTGYPKNGSKNYFKAAENYAIYGDNFLDFPKDTSTCFAGLGSTGGSVSNAPPGFERSARLSALYERKQAPSQGPTPATLSGLKPNTLCSIIIHNIPSSQANNNNDSQPPTTIEITITPKPETPVSLEASMSSQFRRSVRNLSALLNLLARIRNLKPTRVLFSRSAHHIRRRSSTISHKGVGVRRVATTATPLAAIPHPMK